MQLGLRPDPELEPKRAKTLLISIGLHVALLVFLVLNPDLFNTASKRTIRIAGADYDLSKNQLTELLIPREQRPQPKANEPPLQQPPPQPQQEQPPLQAQQPPPPPQPPPREMPAITPEDVIKEGARPDGQVGASRGNTRQQAMSGNDGLPGAPKPVPPKVEEKESSAPKIAMNTNPNGMSLPSLMNQANKIVRQSIDDQKRTGTGPHTGIQQPGQEQPNFAADDAAILSDPRGYDFGPYMNQVVNRVRINWYSAMPEIARAPFSRRGKVVIIFQIERDGTITNFRLAMQSGTDPLDRAAESAIRLSNPFQKLPSNFDGPNLVLQFTFMYNYPPQ